MSQIPKRIEVELSAASPIASWNYYAELTLPAQEYEVQDALQRVRAADREQEVSVSILECEPFPLLADAELDSPSIHELNFLAKRMAGLSDDEQTVFGAVVNSLISASRAYGPVHIRDIINSTYGLTGVPVLPGITNLEELGRFAVENGLIDDIRDIPEDAVRYLHTQQIGRIQQKNDGGVFWSGSYVAAGHYQRREVYNGKQLPQEDKQSSPYVFRARISQSKTDDPQAEQYWIDLPLSDGQFQEMSRYADGGIEDFYCHAVLSSIPQLNGRLQVESTDLYGLNETAKLLRDIPPSDQVKLKAVFTVEPPKTLNGVAAAVLRLGEYELSTAPDSEEQFFKEYLQRHLDDKMDRAWLDVVSAGWDSRLLMKKLGATLTPYGVISARGHSLYEFVPYEDVMTEEAETPQMCGPQL